MEEEKKLGAVLLTGLMIGPILGSGIVLLPPIVYETVGDWAIFAWGSMMLVSFFFAFLFGKLSLQFPGDAGVANAVEFAFGKHIKRLTALYLIFAVCFGPVALMTVAAQYLHPSQQMPLELIGFCLLIVGTLLLLKNVTSVGRIAFIVSTVIVVILFFSSIYSLAVFPKTNLFVTPFSLTKFGYSLLLLFWTLVGWEIIGNYSAEIRDPARTIPKAVIYSATTIMLVSMTIAAGIQWIDSNAFNITQVSVTMIIFPIFGRLSALLMGIITAALCMCTYILIVGGVSRLIASQAEENFLPEIFGKRSKNNVPVFALLALVSIHSLICLAVYLDILTLEKIVATANGFFLANALCGILASIRIFSNKFIRIMAALLAVLFLIILFFSSLWILITISILTLYFFWKQRSSQIKSKVVTLETEVISN
ncbi:MAG: amino acid permease [Desulfobacteraceae bacterium]|nr:amino acid permease [Desulfobacteraceae bacterium]